MGRYRKPNTFRQVQEWVVSETLAILLKSLPAWWLDYLPAWRNGELLTESGTLVKSSRITMATMPA
jgi:hypothetical protein